MGSSTSVPVVQLGLVGLQELTGIGRKGSEVSGFWVLLLLLLLLLKKAEFEFGSQ
jgi:hypothetical protein